MINEIMDEEIAEITTDIEGVHEKPTSIEIRRIEIKPFEYPWKWKDWKEGEPKEKINFEIGDKRILLANFNQKTVSEEQLREASEVLGLFAQHFPDILERIKYFIVNAQKYPSALNDEENFPLNGQKMMGGGFGLQPRTLENSHHRIAAVSNWKGTIAHEITHHGEDLFISKWKENTDQPISEYGRRSKPEEDLCDSMVAYLFDPNQLQQASPAKYEIIKAKDQQRDPIVVKISREL